MSLDPLILTNIYNQRAEKEQRRADPHAGANHFPSETITKSNIVACGFESVKKSCMKAPMCEHNEKNTAIYWKTAILAFWIVRSKQTPELHAKSPWHYSFQVCKIQCSISLLLLIKLIGALNLSFRWYFILSRGLHMIEIMKFLDV